MMVYTPILAVKEILQMRSLGKNAYLSQASNITDLVAIICVFATSILTLVNSLLKHGNEKWTENILLFVVLLTWFQICTDLLQCLPSAIIQKNLGMFFYVAKSYVKILAGFAPFLVAFAAAFRGKGGTFSQ